MRADILQANWFLLAMLGLSTFVLDAREPHRPGSAWSDRSNPVAIRWNGERLDLWSLQVPTRPALSEILIADRQGESASISAVDILVRHELARNGLPPAEPADRRTLLRRVMLDLVGLPPSAEEFEAFEKDSSPDAYERVVDRLLASPQYGVRWARHWLDVVRYSDSNGFERDEYRESMWRYRDYVVQAWNDDKPYDQFVCEQICGDELDLALPDASQRADRRTATGYLRLGQLDTFKQFFDTRDAARDELMVDLTVTTGAAFLGQTLACCRCHDHKSDPILQIDHYRIRSYFAGIELEDELIVDSLARETEVRLDNERIEARLVPMRETLSGLLVAERRRLTERVLAELTPTIREAFEKSENDRSDLERSLVEPVLTRLDFSVSELIAEAHGENKEKSQRLSDEIDRLEATKQGFTTVLGVRESNSSMRDTQLLEGGDYTQPRETIQPGWFSVIAPDVDRCSPIQQGKSSGRRMQLANWIVSRDNPWTARVLANRLWHYHFGHGIVRTPDDLGYSGDRPSHPMLLDWLATELMDSDWSIKRIQREIVLSATYRQCSQASEAAQSKDPNNIRFSHQSLRRMDAETIRDSILFTTGNLDLGMGGEPRWPAVPDQVVRATLHSKNYQVSAKSATHVRSLYLVRKRSVPFPMLSVFQSPDGNAVCGRRETALNVAQSLTMLNDPLVLDSADTLANRLLCNKELKPSEQIERAFQILLARKPTQQEQAYCLALWNHPSASHRGLAEVCRAILNTNEFLSIE